MSALIVLDVHGRDVLETLAEIKCDSLNSHLLFIYLSSSFS